MSFTSYTFLFFLLCLFVLYYCVPKKAQWGLLLCAGYVFYYFADPVYFIFILTTTISSYFLARAISTISIKTKEYITQHKGELSKEEKKAYKDKKKKTRFALLVICLVFNFGILAVLKYSNFAIANINGILGLFKREPLSMLNLVLPLGISFYTFQTMGYVIDVYREKYEAEKNPFKLALFVSFFPQLIQGPISRFDDLAESLFSEHKFNFRNITFGLERILWGYFKKLVIADRILIAVRELIGNTDAYTGFYVFLGALFYACELYADFTGGIDITIGIAQVLGIKVKENFIRPFFSKGIKEYWRRWHISLGSWFTEYLFYPVSVCKPMLKISKWGRKHLGEQIGKRLPVYAASVAVWLVTGIWHGAAWNFVAWGLGNCLVIMVSQELEPLYAKFHAKFHVGHTWYFKAFQIIRTFLIMSSLRMFDCYRDVPMTFKMFGSMFTTRNLPEALTSGIWNLGLTLPDYVILLIGVAILFTVSMIGRSGSVREKIAAKSVFLEVVTFAALFVVIILFGTYGIGYDESQFIYNQF